MPKMRSDSWIILELLIALVVFGVLSFFVVPVYEKGASIVIEVVKVSLAGVLGYKFGKALPQQASPPLSTPPTPKPDAPPPALKV
jgi:Tfp pilus assembly protein FimT